MEKMDMHARNEYLKVLRERYFKARNKREKTEVLDEYYRNTGQNRKYVIGKMWSERGTKKPRVRGERYDGEVKAVLAEAWSARGGFDCPCGQRLKPALETEIERLRELGEIHCSDETVQKLKEISPATIDRKLRREKEVKHLEKRKGHPKPGSQLKQKIAIRLTDWDTSEVGNVEVDLVEHCGSSPEGPFLNTVSYTKHTRERTEVRKYIHIRNQNLVRSGS
ncbi:MAG: hypothetical protein ACLFVK_01105 [Dehalococcoidia bacterium]